METKFIETPIDYDGTQLRSHWALETCGVKGDALVSFVGYAKVDLSHMVDLEDVIAKKPIYSEKMLHFIAEHFENDLEKMILRQRLFISLLKQDLEECLPDVRLTRKGDDLFLEHFKLTVSIATISPVSVLMHTGINILSRNTPVPTKGLEDFGLNPAAVARSVMNRYAEEVKGIRWARAKVRGVR
ncbi:MAG: DUF366 family protein [Deltaproteobacteria bacterium]|nr:DUF366 family protein [Deltaproteobacteria bacterium]